MTSCGVHLLRASLCLERRCIIALALGGRVPSLGFFCALSFRFRFFCTSTESAYDLLASVRGITEKYTFLLGLMAWIRFHSTQYDGRSIHTSSFIQLVSRYDQVVLILS